MRGADLREERSSRIRSWVEAHAEEAAGLVSALVQIESVNHPPHGNEEKLQRFVAGWLKDYGAEVDVYELEAVPGLAEHPAYMPDRVYPNRPNVLGLFRGSGGGRSLIFSSHADTVYEGTEPWRHPPFSGHIEAGRLYGRGAYDMKGGMAASLMAARCVRELGLPLAGDLLIETVVDEEHGGANGTLAGRLRGPAADMAIIPEPTNLQVCTAHLGGGIWKAEFAGKSGIGFAGEELVSALEATVQFTSLLLEYRDWRREKHPAPAPWTAGRQLEVMPLGIFSGDPNRQLQEKLPATGEVRFWIEGYPGMTGEAIMAELRSFTESHLDLYPLLRSCPPSITPMIRYLNASRFSLDGEGERFLSAVSSAGERAACSPVSEPAGAPFACDGFMFNLHSTTPAVVLGPAGGNAHAADEYLDLDSYYVLIRWYAELIAAWCGQEAGE